MKVTGNMINGDLGSTLVNLSVNGLEIYATYIDNTSKLKVTRLNYNTTLSGTPIVSGAVSVK